MVSTSRVMSMQWPAEVLQDRIELSPLLSYNWLFLWDFLHSINGVKLLVLITGISGQ